MRRGRSPRRPGIRVFAALWLCALGSLCGAAYGQSVEEVLAKVRAAQGLSRLTEHRGGIMLDGSRVSREDGGGPAIRVRLQVGSQGRFVITHEVMGMSTVQGFDGKTVWLRHTTGQSRALSLGERTPAWLRAAIISGAATGEQTLLHFRADPDHPGTATIALAFDADEGRARGRVEISRESWRPVRWTATFGQNQPLTWELEGAVTLDGMTFPELVRESGGAAVRFARAHGLANGEEAERAFDYVPSPAQDMDFDAAATPEVQARRGRNGHLLIRAQIDGKEAGWFMLDTGVGPNLVSRGVAAALGLKPAVPETARGIGRATVPTEVCFARSLRVGPLTIRDPDVQSMDMAATDFIVGEPVAGLLGYQVLARCIAMIDLEKGRLSLYPLGAEPAGAGARDAWRPIQFVGTCPSIEGELEGHPAVLQLDTGGGGDLLVMGPTVRRLNLLRGRATVAAGARGVGGVAAARMGTLKSMLIAGRRLEDLSALFGAAEEESLGNTYIDANIGVGVLSRFVLWTDYTQGKIGFIERAADQTVVDGK